MNLELQLPAGCYILEPVLQPNQIFAESPVRGKHVFTLVLWLARSLRNLSSRYTSIDAPVHFLVETQLPEVTPADLAKFLFNIFDALQIIRQFLALTKVWRMVVFLSNSIDQALDISLTA